MKTKNVTLSNLNIGKISFKVSPEDRALISAIVGRAIPMLAKHGVQYDELTLDMDLTACHANGNPLRLAELMAADNFNFSHDITGIIRHLDRETGQLTGHFSPRFTQFENTSSSFCFGGES